MTKKGEGTGNGMDPHSKREVNRIMLLCNSTTVLRYIVNVNVNKFFHVHKKFQLYLNEGEEAVRKILKRKRAFIY